MPDKGACSLNHRMIGRPTHLSKTFDRARSDVGSGRVQHGVVVGKRNVIEKLQIVLVIECAPAAVAILHTDEPGQATTHGVTQTLGIRIVDSAKGHQDECGVVHIGIKIIAEFKSPAAGIGILVLHLPITGAENLIANNPALRINQGWVSGSIPASSSETMAMAVSQTGEMQ